MGKPKYAPEDLMTGWRMGLTDAIRIVTKHGAEKGLRVLRLMRDQSVDEERNNKEVA